MARAQVVIVKNARIEKSLEATSSDASSSPTTTAPGDFSGPTPAEAARGPGVLRRLLRRKGASGARAAPTEEAPARAPAPPKKTVQFEAPSPTSSSPPAALRLPMAPGTPVTLQEKNTFVHFEQASTPTDPPTRSAPGRAFFAEEESPGAVEHIASAPPVSSVLTGGGTPSRLGARDFILAQRAMEEAAAAPAVSLAPTPTLPATATPPPPPPAAPARGRRCCASLGSAGHTEGQCIPCLMQVRWQAGRCKEPCRFGEMCGRCHEPHTEEELHRVQAAMRKLKRRGGAACAAVLSAAYVKGTAAPVGGGAGRAAMLKQQLSKVVQISL